MTGWSFLKWSRQWGGLTGSAVQWAYALGKKWHRPNSRFRHSYFEHVRGSGDHSHRNTATPTRSIWSRHSFMRSGDTTIPRLDARNSYSVRKAGPPRYSVLCKDLAGIEDPRHRLRHFPVRSVRPGNTSRGSSSPASAWSGQMRRPHLLIFPILPATFPADRDGRRQRPLWKQAGGNAPVDNPACLGSLNRASPKSSTSNAPWSSSGSDSRAVGSGWGPWPARAYRVRFLNFYLSTILMQNKGMFRGQV